MLGSIFLITDNPETLVDFDIDKLDDFENVQLDELITLDFESALSGSGIKWSKGNPVLYDEEQGIAVFEVNILAIEKLISTNYKKTDLNEEDIQKLRIFIGSKRGDFKIFEVATF